MPELPHLILPRAEVDMERRKRPGFGSGVPRDQRQQSQRIQQDVTDALEEQARLRATVIDPRLIVRVRTAQPVPEEEWERAGLTVLGQDDRDSVVLFSSEGELTEFRRRLESYSAPIPQGQKNPSYSNLIGAIEEFRQIEPADRIGSALRDEGFEAPVNFENDRTFLIDVELWETGTQEQRAGEIETLGREIGKLGAEITDRYTFLESVASPTRSARTRSSCGGSRSDGQHKLQAATVTAAVYKYNSFARIWKMAPERSDPRNSFISSAVARNAMY